MEEFTQLIKKLNQAQIDFVIVDRFAAILHGGTQVTQDLNVCIQISPDNIKKLRTHLKDIHPYHRMTPNKVSFLEIPEDLNNIKNLYLSTDLGLLDIHGTVGGIGEFDALVKNAINIELFNEPCKVISIDDLIEAKRFMGRPKDLFTIKELECVKNEIIKS